MGVGRSGPVHLKSGRVVLRALPRDVQNNQESGPSLCARLCSAQACCGHTTNDVSAVLRSQPT